MLPNGPDRAVQNKEDYIVKSLNMLLLCVLGVQASAISAVEPVEMTPDYLRGTWSLDGKAGCGSSNARYVMFRNNGTLEVGQGGEVRRVGFWHLVEDAIVANTLTAPNVDADYHPFFRDSYRYEYVAPRVVRTEADSFAVVIGSDLEKEKQQVMLTRCPE
jgi:hypothetical protein